MNKSLKRGFTLIELLVVIAIIGILASIILASLATARSKGNDSKIEEQLKSIQNAAEIYYDSAGNYGTSIACAGMTSDPTSGMAALWATTAWPNAASPTCIANSTENAYLVYHVMSSNTSNYWCVDSSGKSALETAVPTGTTCQ